MHEDGDIQETSAPQSQSFKKSGKDMKGEAVPTPTAAKRHVFKKVCTMEIVVCIVTCFNGTRI